MEFGGAASEHVDVFTNPHSLGILLQASSWSHALLLIQFPTPLPSLDIENSKLLIMA